VSNLVYLNDYRWNVDWIISDLIDEFFETGTDGIIQWLIQNKEDVGLSEKEIKNLDIEELKLTYVNTSLKMLGMSIVHKNNFRW
jgi:hypothetical protein|tara:strand:+ start:1418 stop:1669 length:252 start_codon:yes stop_codon:yes gene_type:complete